MPYASFIARRGFASDGSPVLADCGHIVHGLICKVDRVSVILSEHVGSLVLLTYI